MTNSELYLKQASGVYGLLSWINDRENLGTPCIISNQTIYLNDLTSRFFSIGFNRKTKNPYLAIQHDETHWIRLISWEGIYIREKDNNLYLVSNKIEGDNLNYPDIPSFAVAIRVESPELIPIIKTFKKIEGRSYSGINGIPKVNFNSSLFSTALINIPKNESYLKNNEAYKSFNDLMSDTEAKLQDKYSEAIPVFVGNQQEAQSLAGKFWGAVDKYLIEDKERIAKEKAELQKMNDAYKK